jgi:hypothetical protein
MTVLALFGTPSVPRQQLRQPPSNAYNPKWIQSQYPLILKVGFKENLPQLQSVVLTPSKVEPFLYLSCKFAALRFVTFKVNRSFKVRQAEGSSHRVT